MWLLPLVSFSFWAQSASIDFDWYEPATFSLCSRRRPNWFASAQLNLRHRGAKIRLVP